MQASRCFYSHKSTDKAVGFSWAGGPCPYGGHDKVCIFNVCDTISKSIFKKKTGTVAKIASKQV